MNIDSLRRHDDYILLKFGLRWLGVERDILAEISK